MKVALAFVLLASGVLSLAATEKNERLLVNRRREKSSSKATKGKGKKEQNQLRMKDIEGVYVYVNKCGQTYLAKITCLRDSNVNIFESKLHGSYDPLCSYAEYKVAEFVSVEDYQDQDGAEPVLDDDGNIIGYDVISPDALTDDGGPIDQNSVCVYAGMFRESSALDGHVLKSIPLATSNGCKSSTTNFQYVVRADVLDDGNLKLHFSSDFGASSYTDDPELCPETYVAIKLEGNEGGRRRSLYASGQEAACDPDPENVYYNQAVCESSSIPSVCPFLGSFSPVLAFVPCEPVQGVVRAGYVLLRCGLFGCD